MPDPPAAATSGLGVAGFAIKRGHNDGTVLIDCETRKVADLLIGRDAEPLTIWLQEHASPDCGAASGAFLAAASLAELLGAAVYRADPRREVRAASAAR
ncbi:hypothetical protein [Paractinoplanes abujensis]|uniref:Uncharacterized protein n=1 Tax=Paractinoplanes abujensis TaxID=882441 RepID=A0A7W7CNT1_9ACTN|nr:hypothetical protein [Actinoplanes abujensis]MBB4691965.1 hypothetical protein [Actinoplanes abujensis]